MFPRLILIVILILVSALSGLACSTVYIEPSGFDPSQYMFVGEITGYVISDQPIKFPQSATRRFDEARGPTAGIVVKVYGTFYTPKPARKIYEVYRFGLGADCGLYSLDLDFMKSRYPIGKLVRIVAGESTHLPTSTDPEIGRLEVRYSGDDVIETRFDPNDKSYDNISSVYDYGSYQRDLIGNPSFELLKDLHRLDIAANQKERNEILDRLTYFPRFCENCTFYLERLYKTHTSSQAEFDHYAELVRKRGMTDEEFKQFQERRRLKYSQQ